ncbi:hypothetical protein AGMMS49992_01530 [Clostridia bacterium]|nr:hypothetical protein AGMMS49992_01530 [Clostridia bacterium]
MSEHINHAAPSKRAAKPYKSEKKTRKRQRTLKERITRWVCGILIAVVALTIVGLAVVTPISMRLLGLTRHVDFKNTLTPDAANLTAEEIQLTTDDGYHIQAWFAPSRAPTTKAAVIFLSGIQGPSVTYYFPHAAWLAGEGYASLPLEMRAHGGSDGERIGLGITEVEDVRAAVRYLRQQLPGVPIVVFGVSMGGAAAINSFGEIPEISALISLSAYTSWPDEFSQMMNGYYGVPKFLAVAAKPFVWLYTGFTFGFDKLDVNPLEEIQKANGRPMLLMHSLEDSTVSYENYETLSEAVPEAESFLRGGDSHLILDWNLIMTPWEDTAYAEAILSFLDVNFGQ